jgi:hypothetical protein
MRADRSGLISSLDALMTRISLKGIMTTTNSFFPIKGMGQSIPVSTATAPAKTHPIIIYKTHQMTSTRHYSSNFKPVEKCAKPHVKMESQSRRYKRNTKSSRRNLMRGRLGKCIINDILYFLLFKT